MHYLCLTIAIIAEVIATSALNASHGLTKLWPTLLSIAGYGVAFLFLSQTLKTMTMSISYAIWSGVGIAGIAIIGAVVFGQKLDVPAILGLSLIIAGVIIINVFSKSVMH